MPGDRERQGGAADLDQPDEPAGRKVRVEGEVHAAGRENGEVRDDGVGRSVEADGDGVAGTYPSMVPPSPTAGFESSISIAAGQQFLDGVGPVGDFEDAAADFLRVDRRSGIIIEYYKQRLARNLPDGERTVQDF